MLFYSIIYFWNVITTQTFFSNLLSHNMFATGNCRHNPATRLGHLHQFIPDESSILDFKKVFHHAEMVAKRIIFLDGIVKEIGTLYGYSVGDWCKPIYLRNESFAT